MIDSVKLSSRICRVLGRQPPEGMTYELFLDQEGQKISKSRGNGLSVEDFLTYGPPVALSQFMYNQPQRAKRLHFDVIPRAVDEYIANLEKLSAAPDPRTSPAWHIHSGKAAAQPWRQPQGLVLAHAAEPCQRGERRVGWTFCGASSAATFPLPALRRSRCWAA